MFKKILIVCLVAILLTFAVACEQEENGVETPAFTEGSTATIENVTPTASVTPTLRPVIYAEDLQIFETTYNYQSFKAYLEQYIKTNEFTYGTPPGMTYDMRDKYQQVSILGYFSSPQDIYENNCFTEINTLWLTQSDNFTDDNNEELERFDLNFNVQYKTSEFVKNALVRDIDKMKAFTGVDTISIGFNNKYYSKLEDVPQNELEKLYNGTEQTNISVSFYAGDVKATMRIVTNTLETGEKMFSSFLSFDYK